MNCSRSCLNVLVCALAMLTALSARIDNVVAGGVANRDRGFTNEKIVFLDGTVTLDTILDAEPPEDSVNAIGPPDAPWKEELPADAIPLSEPDGEGGVAVNDEYSSEEFDAGEYVGGEYVEFSPGEFTWQVGPSGIIYRSYLAGPHEPRISISPFFNANRAIWDATIGGRGGVIRYGDRHPLHPQGWQLDVYGASIVRMDAENHQDLDAADFVFGFPLTYGVDNWQFKLGYAHLSSHLGDEYAIRNPGALADRINYVRDGLVWGTSWFPVAACRLYGEFDWAFHVSDGAGPIHFQFGNELSRPGPTGTHGSPFLALNGRMREEVNYGGDLTAQTGWLWRGVTGKVFRIGAHYYNGKSSQSQFYRVTEEQIGMGLWYDF